MFDFCGSGLTVHKGFQGFIKILSPGHTSFLQVLRSCFPQASEPVRKRNTSIAIKHQSLDPRRFPQRVALNPNLLKFQGPKLESSDLKPQTWVVSLARPCIFCLEPLKALA